jgi:hypothetical protein
MLLLLGIGDFEGESFFVINPTNLLGLLFLSEKAESFFKDLSSALLTLLENDSDFPNEKRGSVSVLSLASLILESFRPANCYFY